MYTDTQSSSFQFVICWRTQAPQSDSFPYSEHVLKSRQGAQCLFLNGLYFSKPDYRCEQAVRENCSFIIFFSHHQMQILFALFGGMYCFSVASSEEEPLSCCTFHALSDGTGIYHCFLLNVVISVWVPPSIPFSV